MSGPAGEPMTNGEFNKFRGHLLSHRPAGVEPGDWAGVINEIFGNNPMGRTRADMTFIYSDWSVLFPKAA